VADQFLPLAASVASALDAGAEVFALLHAVRVAFWRATVDLPAEPDPAVISALTESLRARGTVPSVPALLGATQALKDYTLDPPPAAAPWRSGTGRADVCDGPHPRIAISPRDTYACAFRRVCGRLADTSG
jgi:hypothetical protein